MTSKDYWNERYLTKATSWDMGMVSPPLKTYIDQLQNRDLRILIPGGGNSYEAKYLQELGFRHVTVLDIAPALVQRLQQEFSGTAVDIREEDFFLHEGQYDLILEQTFFCAIPPAQRAQYVVQAHRLLAPGGSLSGVLFNRDFEQDGPPFGGHAAEYEQLFRPYFDFRIFEPCYNSHPARQGSELFIHFIRKNNPS